MDQSTPPLPPPNSPSASIFVTKQIKHNTFQYYAWKVAYVASLVVEHAWICWDLAKKLFHFLIAGSRVWVFMVARLFAFITILMPGWAALLRYYIFDSLIIRNIDFGRGPRCRNLLDVYLPQPNNPRNKKHGKVKGKVKRNRNEEGGGVGKGRSRGGAVSSSRHRGKAPVIVFVSGGAWIIGYKLWSGLMARELSRAGYVVVVPDYRNFPQGNIVDMVADLRAALLWTTTNCAMFGGDPEQIILAGQSAGAHISLCALVELYEESLAKEFIKKNPLASLNLSNRTVHLANNDIRSPDGDVWRDNVSVKTKGSDKDSDGEGEEDTDEEVVTAASSYDDRSLLTSNLLRHSTMPFPTDRSDFMEYKVSQDTNESVSMSIENIGGEGIENRHRQNSVETYDGDDEHVLKISDIKMYVGISGPYNMVGLMQHLHARGLDVSILHYIFAFDIKKYSPTLRLANIMGVTVANTLSMQCLTLEESSLSIYKFLFGGARDTEVEEEVALENKKKQRAEDGGDYSDDDDDISWTRKMKHSESEISLDSYVVDQLFPERKVSSQDEEHSKPEDDFESSELSGEGAGKEHYFPPAPHQLKGFPSVALFHGSKDKSIPAMVSDELEALLKSGGVKVTNRVYENMSHTDPILENVLEGNTELVVDIIDVIEKNMEFDRSNGLDNMSALGSGVSNDGKGENLPVPHSERCEAYLHNNQTASWPISKGMMRIARMMNPF